MSILLTLALIVGLILGLYALIVLYREKINRVLNFVDFLPDFENLIPPKRPKFVKVVVFVPDRYAEAVRTAIGEAGGGRIGNYSFISFSTAGIARFKPENGESSSVEGPEKLETIEEERIEFATVRQYLPFILAAIDNVYPSKEKVIDIYEIDMPRNGF